ncbi:Uncharacterised protein [Segatella oris]|jgi:hypothetical protein|uniref:Uncharacterized protein n=1 Tax=Segatella oris TaxID=28135 RepID=A0A3S4T443_9BACT|nr:Uncharacterised protein [Segatella oris]VEH16623.1 Uncharacterised protein [Segatella oris]
MAKEKDEEEKEKYPRPQTPDAVYTNSMDSSDIQPV